MDGQRGEYFFNIPLAPRIINSNIPLAFKTISDWRVLFTIIIIEEQRKTSHVKNNMYDIDCKIGPGSSGLSCVCVITRESGTILPLSLSPSFLF